MEKEIKVGDTVWVYDSFCLKKATIIAIHQNNLNKSNIIEYSLPTDGLFHKHEIHIESEIHFKKRIA